LRGIKLGTRYGVFRLMSVSSTIPSAPESGWRLSLPLRLQLALLLATAALLGVGFALERIMHDLVGPAHLQWILVVWDSTAWFVWLLAAPTVMTLVRRYPITGGEFHRHVPPLVVGGVLIYLGVINLRFLVRIIPNLWRPPAQDLPIDWATYWTSNLVSLPMDFLTCGGFFAAAVAIDYYFQHRRRAEEMLQLRLRTAQLEAELVQAELSTLRGQLHPHFLFNSFNAVSTLVRQGRNEAAVEVIAQLSALLRDAIERTGQHELPLEQELDFIRRYLAIERLRFGEKLLLEFDVEAATLPGIVPNLVLQPLVENAIKHGISRRTQPGRLCIGARRTDTRLELVVENDGAEPAAPPGPSGGRVGIGLTNTRRRLDKIYGATYQLDLQHRSDGGVRVRLELPFTTAGVA
jgi:hypothetical protein